MASTPFPLAPTAKVPETFHWEPVPVAVARPLEPAKSPIDAELSVTSPPPAIVSVLNPAPLDPTIIVPAVRVFTAEFTTSAPGASTPRLTPLGRLTGMSKVTVPEAMPPLPMFAVSPGPLGGATGSALPNSNANQFDEDQFPSPPAQSTAPPSASLAGSRKAHSRVERAPALRGLRDQMHRARKK